MRSIKKPSLFHETAKGEGPRIEDQATHYEQLCPTSGDILLDPREKKLPLVALLVDIQF